MFTLPSGNEGWFGGQSSRHQRNRQRRGTSKLSVERLEDRTLLSFSSLVYPGDDGRLVYAPDDQGNTIPDFSMVGYQTGVVPLPGTPGGLDVRTLPRVTLHPTSGDRTADIQNAIDQVSQFPLQDNGFRGVVWLEAGEYDIADHVEIRTDGVILHGVGRDPSTGTRLLATGTLKRYDTVHADPLVEGVIQIKGDTTGIGLRGSAHPRRASGVAGQDHAIVNSYVPVGARTFTVASTAGLNVGDPVIVHRPSTHEWLQAIGMSTDPDQYGTAGWPDNSADLDSDRIITAIDGNQITIDAPLTDALEAQFGGGTVYKYSFPGRIQNVGVQDLLGDSTYTSPTDENHAWTFISLVGVENAFVNHITAYHYAFGAVHVQKTAKWITVEDAYNRDPISQITGGRRYSFDVEGQLTLVRDAHTRGGRHDFAQGSIVPGPNAFVDCTGDSVYDESGPHNKWSTGTLYENVVLRPAGTSRDRGALSFHNRGLDTSGSLQGWAGANMVAWNCNVSILNVFRPPTAQNYAIGCVADQVSGDGFIESFGQSVEPASLYDAQMADRLSGGFIHLGPGSPHTGAVPEDTPAALGVDLLVSDSSVSIGATIRDASPPERGESQPPDLGPTTTSAQAAASTPAGSPGVARPRRITPSGESVLAGEESWDTNPI
jgi:hypothetical protein